MRARHFGPLLALAALAAPASAPAAGALPDFDARTGEHAAQPAAVTRARAATDARFGTAGAVAVDRRTGGLRVVARTDRALTGPARGDAATVALAYVRDHPDVVGLDATDLAALRIAARYRDVDGITHITWRQFSRGIPSYDTTLGVNLGRRNEILNVTGSPVHALSLPTATPAIGPGRALALAAEAVGGALRAPSAKTGAGPERRTQFADGGRASLVAVADADGDRLGWQVTVAGPDPLVYDVVVDAATGAVLARHSLTSFVADASVFENHPDPDDPAGGVPHTVDLEADPTWLSQSASKTILSGDNAHAYADVNANDVADPSEEIASVGGNWNFPQTGVGCAAGATSSVFSGICTWDGSSAGTESTNRAQTTTQLFYFVNRWHDWLAAAPIGFTTASHNFQIGGPGGDDPVLAEANDGSGTNNANFNTSADGVPGRMQMYLFGGSGLPAVSSSDEADVIYHEYTHGLSNRLVNNGLGTALMAKQSRAMGEGWSDWFAHDFLVANGFETDTPADGDIVTGAYVTNNLNVGIRHNAIDCAVGSTDAVHCPGTLTAGPGGFTFGDIGKIARFTQAGADDLPYFEEHDVGEVWAETLWDLRTALGGSVTRGLLAEAMRLSPVPPSMLDERDAILLADVATGGTHHDAIWTVFAARGMGVGASTTGPGATRAVESFATPGSAVKAGTPVVTDPAPLADADAAAEPGETVRVSIPLRNLTPTALNAGPVRVTTPTAGVVVGDPVVDYGSIAAGATKTPAATFAVTVPATLACGTPVELAVKVGGVTADSTSLPVGAPTTTPAGGYVSTDVPKTVTSSSLVNQGVSTLTIPDAKAISGLRVHVKVLHNNIGDLFGRLEAPSGKEVLLFERPGATNGGSSGNDIDVTLDDTASQSIQGVGPTSGASGVLRPDQPLSQFKGEAAHGVWTLRVADLQTNGIAGTITEFSILTDDPVCSTTAPALPIATTAAATGVTATTATVNGTVDATGSATQYAFQYGTTTEYDQATPPGDGGAGMGAATHSASLTGLTPGATYHFRMVGLRGGTVVAAGSDTAFVAADPQQVAPMPSPSPAPTAKPTATPTAAPGPTVTGLNARLKLSKRRTGTISFRVTPTGGVGKVTVKVAKQGKAKGFTLATKRFTASKSGAVKLTLKASKAAFRKLGKRKGKRASAKVSISYGGRTFSLPIAVRR